MPRRDGTGPMGQGAMTGRGAGYCAGTEMPVPGNAAPNPGFGLGGGYRCGLAVRPCFGNGGGGRRTVWRTTGLLGRGRSAGATASPVSADSEAEKQALKNQVEVLQSQLESAQKRLALMEQGDME